MQYAVYKQCHNIQYNYDRQTATGYSNGTSPRHHAHGEDGVGGEEVLRLATCARTELVV